MNIIKLKLLEALALAEQYIISATGQKKALAQDVVEKTRQAIDFANQAIAIDAGSKKKNLIYGEFRLPGGRFDFEPSKPIPLVMEGKKFTIITGAGVAMESQFADFLKATWNIQDSDIILSRWWIDNVVDTLTFVFCFKTDLDFKDNGDIAIETPALRAYGVLSVNKVFMRASEMTEFPDAILEYKLKGFAIPYALKSDPAVLLGKLRESVADKGDLADLRGFALPYRPTVDAFVADLKNKKWNSIFTQWGRHKLLADGSYRSY